MPRVLVPIADGSEDIEVSCITDILARAGIDVVVANAMMDRSFAETPLVTLARHLVIKPPVHMVDVVGTEFDAVLVPGGMPGATHLAACAPLKQVTMDLFRAGKLVGAICASPAVVLGPFGVLEGIPTATCYPGFHDKLPTGTHWVDEPVVLHKNVLTSQGPGTAIEFALVAVATLINPGKAIDVAKGLLVPIPKLFRVVP